MGQKVNPHGLRVGVIKDWDSRWYARPDKVGDLLVEDFQIREFLKKTLYAAGVPKIEIERDNVRVKIYIHCSRPGVIIGKGGAEIERLRLLLEKRINKPVSLSLVEVKSPDTNAQLVAEGIASQLERRISFRRAMKNAMGRAMRMGVRGVKVNVSGRLGGAEIARDEAYHEGTIPLQTLRADIEYGFAEAHTTYGRIGVKVWIYKGEVLSQTLRTTPRTMDTSRPPRENRDRDRGDRRGGGAGGKDGDRRQGGGGYRGGQGGQGGGGYRGGQGGQGGGGYRGGQGGQGSQDNRGSGDRFTYVNPSSRLADKAPPKEAPPKEGGDE
jgi:small subunit ribosomal protein S3